MIGHTLLDSMRHHLLAKPSSPCMETRLSVVKHLMHALLQQPMSILVKHSSSQTTKFIFDAGRVRHTTPGAGAVDDAPDPKIQQVRISDSHAFRLLSSGWIFWALKPPSNGYTCSMFQEF